MHENEKKTTEIRSLLKRYLCDPVLVYTVITMTSIMYHYRDTMLTAVYGLASLVIGAILFRLFDFMMNHRISGAAVYLALIFVFVQAAVLCMREGEENFPVSFGVWFITPQAAVEFNAWYTLGIFLLFMFFMSSVIYYFTRVRYRIFMGFLVFIIPFAIYGKEAEQMPIAFIILMAVGYILLFVYFRQLHNSDTVVVTKRKETWQSVGIYAVLFAAIAAVVPKPQVDADRAFIDSLISAERFTDRLVGMLGNFSETSSGGQYRGNKNDTPLYNVSAEDELHFKTATYSTYHYYNDSWEVGDADTKSRGEYDREYDVGFWRAGELTQAILTAAELDGGFAEEYGLSGYFPEDIAVPEERTAVISLVYPHTRYAPVPQFAKELIWTNEGGTLEVFKTGLLHSQSDIDVSSTFVYGYYRDTFFTNVTNKQLTDIISQSDYAELLQDAEKILSEYYFDESADETMIRYAELLYYEYEDYMDYCSSLLDYGGSERIYDLAQEITQGLDSDYDKAKAIEQYFFSNDYVYDLSYVKPRGENVENFLFNSKRGVCYEYATSMVLLARAAGIPARYCEGYLVTEPSENPEYDYVVTAQDAHGYPELYIEGFGWTTFEPTITAGEEQEDKKSLSEMLMIAGAALFGLLILILVSIKIYPPVYHKIFIVRCRRKSPSDAARAVMYRLCRIYHISGVNTSHEAADKIMEISGVDVSISADLFDAAVYGRMYLDGSDTERTISAYISAYEAYRRKSGKKE